MAKGKHRERAARKRGAEDEEQLQRLRMNLRDAKATVLALRRRIVDQEELTAEIGRLRIQVEENTSVKYEELETVYHHLLTQVEENQDFFANVKKIHENNIIKAIIAMGGGMVGYSNLTAFIRNAPTIAITSDHVMGLPAGAAAIIERRKDHTFRPAKRRRTLRTLAKMFPDEEFVQELAGPILHPSGKVIEGEYLPLSKKEKEAPDDPS